MKLTAVKVLTLLAWLLCAAQFAAGQGGRVAEPPRGGAVEQVWKEFSPAGGGFSVAFPSAPTEESEQVETKLGKLTDRTFSSQDGGRLYMAAYTDFPQPITDPAAIKRMLDNGRDQALSNTKSRLLSEKEITFDGNFGREVVAENDVVKIRSRFYWVRQRMYQMLLVTANERGKTPAAVLLNEGAAAKFFDSFKLKSDAK